MIKKITVEQLKPGVFVHDFNCGWLHHPFLRNRVKLNTDKEIEKVIQHQIREVYIDTDFGIDIDDAPTKAEVDAEIQTNMEQLSETEMKGRARVSLKEEIIRAHVLLTEAKKTTQLLMDDVKRGKKIDMHKVKAVVATKKSGPLVLEDCCTTSARSEYQPRYSTNLGRCPKRNLTS